MLKRGNKEIVIKLRREQLYLVGMFIVLVAIVFTLPNVRGVILHMWDETNLPSGASTEGSTPSGVWTNLNADYLDGLDSTTIMASGGSGGGSCFTNWDDDTCPVGYANVTSGFWKFIFIATGVSGNIDPTSGGAGIVCSNKPNINFGGVSTPFIGVHTVPYPCAVCCK